MGGLAGSAPFTYTPTGADWLRILPELILFGAALLVMLADLITPNGRKGWLAAVGLLGVIATAIAAGVLYVNGDGGAAFYNMVSDDKIALVADFIILFSVGLGLLYSPGYLERQRITREGEYYTLLLLAALGMMLMSAAISLMTIFVGLEVLSLALYVLCALAQDRDRSQEAGMKYFILSSFASAFLLYGMALTYGATGATALAGIRDFVTHHALALTDSYGPLLLAGLGLMAVGFCFKVSAVPFQAWTPDVYVGAPTPVTAFMSVGTKVAAFMGLIRVFFYALSPQSAKWAPIFWAVAILTMVGGNLLAVTQRDVKRMLAYSSIANAGYMLVAVATDTQRALASLLIYLGVYAVMNIGAFGVVLAVERNDGLGTTLDDFAGLARRRPGLAAGMAILLFGLSGLFGAGLIGKYYVFYAAIVGNHLDLATVGILSSVLGMFYYLRVVWAMYFTPPQPVIGGVNGATSADTEAPFVVAAPAS
ncbi:MAG: NADH-quinone oxidoreductase subunit N, partial [Ktedonobacterales bacterium]